MSTRVETIMQRSPKSVPPDMTLADLDRWLLAERISGAPVVDRAGKIVGVISRSDIARQVAVGLAHSEIIEDFYGEYTIRGPSETPGDDLHQATLRMRDLSVADAMSDRVLAVRPEATLADAARVLLENGVHRALVVDDSGTLVGLVSALDYVRIAAG